MAKQHDFVDLSQCIKDDRVVAPAIELCTCPSKLSPDVIDWQILTGPFITMYYALLGILGFVVVLLNIAVIVGIARDKRLHLLHNLLVGGQALTDLAVGILVLLFNFGTIANGGNMLGGQEGCTVYGFGIVITCHSTVFSLALIAHSRKLRILENSQITTTRMLFMYVFWVWTVPCLLLVYYMSVSVARLACSGAFCNPLWNAQVMIVCGIALGCPIVYMISVYVRLHRQIENSRQAVKSHLHDGPAEKSEMRAHNRTTRLMVLMSASILFMWIPLYIYFAFTATKLAFGVEFSGFWAVEKLLGIAAISSSMCSPLIYAFKNRQLKIAMKYAFLPMRFKQAAIAREKHQAMLDMAQRNSGSGKSGSTKPRQTCCGSLWAILTLKETPRSVVDDLASSHASGAPPSWQEFRPPRAVPGPILGRPMVDRDMVTTMTSAVDDSFTGRRDIEMDSSGHESFSRAVSDSSLNTSSVVMQ